MIDRVGKRVRTCLSPTLDRLSSKDSGFNGRLKKKRRR
jgi:hypothetical protein